jgi:magnesium transporter
MRPSSRQEDLAAARDLSAIAREHPIHAVPVARPGEAVAKARASLVGRDLTAAHDVVVLAGDEVRGIVDLRKLLAAPADTPIESLMDPDPPILSPGQNPSAAAHRMAARGGCSLIVVDEEGRFQGLVPPHRIISVLLAEHDEDMARVGGYAAGSARARGAASEPVIRRLRHRFPWLLVGLIGAMASAVLVGAFEHRLEENLLVALFVPAVVYMADAVGTQTETVLIRALAAGVTIGSMVRRELLTGAAVGVMIAAAFFLFALAGWHDERLAVAVGIALFASCSIATGLAMILPAIFERLGFDPAFGSGPLATVIQDLLSILVYFSAVVAIGV